MKFCEKCNVFVETPVKHCPLCYASLLQRDGARELPAYPDFTVEAEKYNLLYRILLFLSLAASLVCVIVNLFASPQIWWSLIVVGNILYVWAAVGTAIRRRSKIGFNILVQAFCLALLMVLLDWFSGYTHWALNYVVPFLFVTAMLTVTIVILVRRMAIRDVLLYFILTALLGFIPLLLKLFGLVTVLWPSLTSALCALLSLISLFIFADKTTKNELGRRFHI